MRVSREIREPKPRSRFRSCCGAADIRAFYVPAPVPVPVPGFFARATGDSGTGAGTGTGTVMSSRYARQISLPQFGEVGQSKLRGGSVLIVGAGGLGSPASIYLAAAGVATFDSSKFLVGAKWRIYHLPRGGMIYVGDHYGSKTTIRRRQTRAGDLPCLCPACLFAKRIEFFQEPKAESVAMLALHNYYMMKNEVQLIKLAMDEGWFHYLFLDRAKKSPGLRRAMGPLGFRSLRKMRNGFLSK